MPSEEPRMISRAPINTDDNDLLIAIARPVACFTLPTSSIC